MVVAVSYSLRMDSAALTSFTKPDLSENFTSNKELTACRLNLLAISEKNPGQTNKTIRLNATRRFEDG